MGFGSVSVVIGIKLCVSDNFSGLDWNGCVHSDSKHAQSSLRWFVRGGKNDQFLHASRFSLERFVSRFR